MIISHLGYNVGAMEIKENSKNVGMYHKMVVMALELAVVFAVPAILAALLGPRIDIYMGTKNTWTLVLILCAFVISWALVIVRYKKMTREIKERNKQ